MYSIQGKVINGSHRGKGLGFPTANVLVSNDIPEGIYVSETTVEDRAFQSVTFIGAAKTFDEEDVKAETFILDFDGDLYNKEIEVRLLKKIRENAKFESVAKLVEKMNEDIEVTRKYFEKHGR